MTTSNFKPPTVREAARKLLDWRGWNALMASGIGPRAPGAELDALCVALRSALVAEPTDTRERDAVSALVPQLVSGCRTHEYDCVYCGDLDDHADDCPIPRLEDALTKGPTDGK